MIQIFTNSIGAEELAAVQRVFASRWLGFGKEAQQFQEELGARLGSSRVLAVNCATAAAYIAMKTLGIGRGDEVIISSVNFVGCANAIIDAGATPVFADVDPRTLNITPGEIERLRTPQTKAVLMLHYGGQAADMDPLLAAAHGLRLIEDSACSLFSKYHGRNCGTLGDIGFYSFDAMKILVTGDGGAMVLKNDGLLERAKEFRYMGLANRQSGIDAMKDGGARWWEIELNGVSNRYVMNDISAAIGREQLKKVDGFLARRRQVWDAYQRGLAGIGGLVLPPEPAPGTTSSYYLYWLTVPGRRDALARHLIDRGVYCTFRYFPLHLVTEYRANVRLPQSEQVNLETLNIPLHQNLTDDEVGQVIDAVRGFFRG